MPCNYLSRVSASIEVVAHSDSGGLVRELNKCLISVGPHIELGLDQSPKWLSQLHQLLVCSLIRKISDVQNLQNSTMTSARDNENFVAGGLHGAK